MERRLQEQAKLKTNVLLSLRSSYYQQKKKKIINVVILHATLSASVLSQLKLPVSDSVFNLL